MDIYDQLIDARKWLEPYGATIKIESSRLRVDISGIPDKHSIRSNIRDSFINPFNTEGIIGLLLVVRKWMQDPYRKLPESLNYNG